jgi:integrase
MPLTDIEIRQTKPGATPIKLTDGAGMFLLLNPNGSRYWRFRYRINGREKTVSLGVYPEVTLKLARERREKFRRQLFDGIDSSQKRKEEKAAISDTFEAVAREWLTLQAKTDARSNRPALSKSTWDKALQVFERLIFPYIGSRPISAITVPELLRMLKRIEEREHHETCHRAKQRCGQIFSYAIVTGRAERDLTSDLRGAPAPVATRNFSAITEPAKVGELLRAIDGYGGHEITRIAMKLAPLVFVRPGELRAAEWKEFDLDRAEWRIPAARMKMRDEHLVPLSSQALLLLRELHPLTGDGRYLFPSPRSWGRPMSENAITAALRRMGYTGDEMTWHGFRSLVSTCLNEQG